MVARRWPVRLCGSYESDPSLARVYGMEAEVADASAPADVPDPQIPNIFPWWDGQAWTAHEPQGNAPASSALTSLHAPTHVKPSPAPIPELALSPAQEPCHCGELFGEKQELEDEVAQLLHTLAERGTERDRLRMELVDLNSQIPTLRHERDELLVAAASLRGVATDLGFKRQELTSLRSEIQSLKYQKSSLNRELVERRGLTKSARTGYQKFHDS